LGGCTAEGIFLVSKTAEKLQEDYETLIADPLNWAPSNKGSDLPLTVLWVEVIDNEEVNA